MAVNQLKGLDAVLRNLRKEVDKIDNRGQKGLYKAALLLQSESIDECPVDEGNLHNSSYIASDITTRGLKLHIGYNAAYAARVHENPRSGKTSGYGPLKATRTNIALKRGGRGFKATSVSIKRTKYKTWAKIGKWKFLEDPFKRLHNRLLDIIKKETKV